MLSLEEDSGIWDEEDSVALLDCGWESLDEDSETCFCDDEDSLELLFSEEDEDSFVFPFSEEDDTSGFTISSELDEILAKISSFADVESLQAVNAKENSAEAVRLAAAFVKLFIYYLLWGDKVEIFSLLNHNELEFWR